MPNKKEVLDAPRQIYQFPNKPVAAPADLFLLSDSEDDNEVKNISYEQLYAELAELFLEVDANLSDVGDYKETRGNIGLSTQILVCDQDQDYTLTNPSPGIIYVNMSASGHTLKMPPIGVSGGLDPSTILEISVSNTSQNLTIQDSNGTAIAIVTAGQKYFAIPVGTILSPPTGWQFTRVSGAGTGSNMQNTYNAGSTIAMNANQPIVITAAGGTYGSQQDVIGEFSYNGVESHDTTNVYAISFTATKSGAIVALCYADSLFSSGTRTVGLFEYLTDTTGTLLAQVNVAKTDPLDTQTGLFRTASITPVSITAGTRYVISSVTPPSDPLVFFPTFNPAFGVLDGVSDPFVVTVSPTLIYPQMYIYGNVGGTPTEWGGQNAIFQSIVGSDSTLTINDVSSSSSILRIESITQSSKPIPDMSTEDRDLIPDPVLNSYVLNIDTGMTNVYTLSGWEDAILVGGENYLSLVGKTITASAIDLASSNVTGLLPASNLVQTDIVLAQSQVTNLVTDLAAKLNLSGGTMTGALTLNADASSALQPVTLQQMNAALVGLWDDRGNYDASVNAYPSSGGSGTGGAILKGDIWTVSVAGTLPVGQVVEPGDTVRALVDTPGNTQANWAIAQNNLGYTPLSNVLNSAQIFVGNGSNVATGVAVTGDVALFNTGQAIVQKINGSALGSTTPGAGYLLVGSGSVWQSTAISGDVTINASGTTFIGAEKVTNAMLQTISAGGLVSNSATTATSANTANAIVARNVSGDFSAGVITASLSGNAATATALQTARAIGGVNFDGTADIVPQTIQSASESSDTTCFPLFITASGAQSLQPKNNENFSYDSSTNKLSLAGLNLSGLTASSIVTTDGSKNLATVSNPQTFTPTIGDGTNNFSTSTAIGQYYQLGSLLFVNAQIIWTGKGSASAGAGVRVSLPAPLGANCARACPSPGYVALGFTGTTIVYTATSGNSYFQIYGVANNGVTTNVTVSQLGNTGEIQYTAVYWIN
jgi:hypothetical protein